MVRVTLTIALIVGVLSAAVSETHARDPISGFFNLLNQDEVQPKPDPPDNAPDNPPAQPPVAPPDAPPDAPPANGDAADAKPAVPAAPLRIVVVAVKGRLARVRTAADQPWVMPKVGMELPQGAEVRTGLRSAVMLRIGANQTITLDRLGTIKVLRAIQEQAGEKKIKTDVGMPYGRARYKIAPAGTQHESTIRAPSTTLAVRGSDVTYQDDALGAIAYGQGRLQLVIKDIQRTARSFGGGTEPTTVTPQQPAAGVARDDATADPKGGFAARTGDEDTRVDEAPSVGGEDLRELRDLRRDSIFFNAGVTIPANVGATAIFVGQPGFTNVDLSITSPPAFAVSIDNPVSSNGRATLTASPLDGIAGIDGSGSEVIAIDLTGLSATTLTFSLDLRSADAGPVVVPVFQFLESVQGQPTRLLNDQANPAIPVDGGVTLIPGVTTNITTTLTVPSGIGQ